MKNCKVKNIFPNVNSYRNKRSIYKTIKRYKIKVQKGNFILEHIQVFQTHLRKFY